MNKDQLSAFLGNYFRKFGFEPIRDDNLKHIDACFSDRYESKYVFACSFFDHKDQLLSMWQAYQMTDIALYLQKERYINKDIRWDMYYLLFNLGEDISIEEFLHIEKDRFCCKKMLFNTVEHEKLKNELNTKLPLTDNYYALSTVNYNTDEVFLHELRGLLGMNPDIFTDELFNNVVLHKEKWCEFLKDRR